VINIACGRRITVTQLAHRMAELCGRPELTPIYKPDRAGDVKHSLADSLARENAARYDRSPISKTASPHDGVVQIGHPIT